MVSQRNWYDPQLVKRVRIGNSVSLILTAAAILYLNYGWLIRLIKNIIDYQSE
jgi:hypothetical protein